MKLHIMLLTALLGCASAVAETPPDQLAKPPADARHFFVQSTGGKHGDSWVWTTADGAQMARETFILRGQVFDTDARLVSGADGMPATYEIRGSTPQGDAAELFSISDGIAHWKSPVDSGSAPYSTPAFYATYGGPFATNALLVEKLVASPDHRLRMLPGGEAQAEHATSLELEGRNAGEHRKVELWIVTGFGNTPLPIWLDGDGHFFGASFGLAWLPEAYAGEQKKLEDAQSAVLAARTATLAQRLVTKPGHPVAFTHVQLFDSEKQRFLADQTVVVTDGKISAVGAADKQKVPDGAQLVDGRGKTLLPGLWDCHMHVGDDYTGLQELSMGVTSVRDPGNDDLRTIDRRERSAAGKLLMPHVYPSSLIDGKGPNTAQVANVATSQEEAIALVDRAKKNGFTGVKFYGTFNPAWLKASIAEAHKLGLHVHGHIPQGIRPMDAVAAGYDEITHINWIIMQAMPDSVIAVDNGMARFEGPGRYGKDVDLNGPALSGLVNTMAKKHLYSDPTMVAFESLYVPENGDLSPAQAPFVGTLPPAIERGFRAGGFAVPKDLTRADYRASWAKMVGLLKKMHEAGVPIVAGTDGSGIEIVHELEIYQSAGFTPAQAIAAATFVPATLVGQQAHTGSIAVGKTADLMLVEGDPSKSLAALRQTRVVMLDGKLLDPDALRTAAGFSGRPH